MSRPIYHATNAANVPSILADGLRPSIGTGVIGSPHYDPTTAIALVYMAEDPISLPWQVATHLGVEISEIAFEDLVEHGAVCISDFGPGVFLNMSGEIVDHEGDPVAVFAGRPVEDLPLIVEEGDFFTAQVVVPSDILTGDRLAEALLGQFRHYLPRHIADEIGNGAPSPW